MNYIVDQQLINYNRPKTALVPQGFVVHATDDVGATAQNEHDYFNSGNRSASAHYVVEWTKIIQMIPDNEQAWHAGATANKKYLSVEICEPANNNASQFQEAWNRAVWLVASKCIQYGWDTSKIYSHADISNLYHETDHTDPIGYFKQYGKSMDQFKNEVQNQINLLKRGYVDMKKIVTYLGDADAFAAIVVARKNQCPLMLKSDYDASGLKADQVIPIGGKPGSDRYSTFKDAANLV
ncbi:peptidoglycan recognition protein family protein [Candidatus Clostridium stratigraminis]|uniref:N-acetylmuramoyl-L-alanine amidase n=1 Tax=Candidatus Clostridium stratigraminis TaxID=3381661 RepID=A0ABW8SYJ9_9CLOT